MVDNTLTDVPQLRRVDVIGVPITATNMHQCVEFITRHLPKLRGKYVCVSNAYTCVMAHEDPSYWRVQTQSLMSVPDGKPLSVIGRKSIPTMGRVTGPDLMRKIFSTSVQHGWKHYFYGNNRENLNLLQKALKSRYPGLSIVGAEPSVFRQLSSKEKLALVDRINSSEADFVWVGIGAPRQEILCYQLAGKVRGLMVGVGGAFNVLAGITSEAPSWVQKIGMEWFYRFIQEPRRLFKRYLVTNSKFIFYFVTKSKRKRK